MDDSQKFYEQDFEVIQLLDRRHNKRQPSNQMRKWPLSNKRAAAASAKRVMDTLPKGSRIIKRESRCDLRPDLSRMPWQLYHAIVVKIPA